MAYNIMTRLILAYPRGMAVVAILVAVAQLSGLVWQLVARFRVGGGNRG